MEVRILSFSSPFRKFGWLSESLNALDIQKRSTGVFHADKRITASFPSWNEIPKLILEVLTLGRSVRLRVTIFEPYFLFKENATVDSAQSGGEKILPPLYSIKMAISNRP